MKNRDRYLGFSLVEVTLALGIAAICLIPLLALMPISAKTNQGSIQQTTANAIISEIAADLNAAARLPPGQISKQFELKNPRWDPTPVYRCFTSQGDPTTACTQTTAPANAVFRAAMTYREPPTDTTSLADIRVSWPAAQSDQTKVAGSAGMFVAINR